MEEIFELAHVISTFYGPTFPEHIRDKSVKMYRTLVLAAYRQ